MQVEKLLAEAERIVALVFRYVAAGGIALLAFGFLRHDRFTFLMVGESKDTISTPLTVLAVVATGLTLYAFHRGLPYVVILYGLHKWLICHCQLNMKAAELEARLAADRFARRSQQDLAQQRFDAFAAEAHFLYVAAWGVLAAVLAVSILGTPSALGAVLAVLIAVFLLTAAVVRDATLMTREVRLLAGTNSSAGSMSPGESNSGLQRTPQGGRR